MPVISSSWKYNSEIINDNITGFLFKTNDVEELKSILLKIVDMDIFPMKKSCIEEAKKYLPTQHIEKIISKMENN